MAKILIDVSDEIYEYVKQNYRYGIGAEVACKLGFAVAEGALLPKGYGKLIDADKLHKEIENIPIKDEDKWFNWMQKTCMRIANAPTIIEADKDGE